MKKINKIFVFMISMGIMVVPIATCMAINVPNPGLPAQTDINQVLVSVIEWILKFLASLAILTIIISGILYMTSGGDSNRIETAKQWLIYSIVGLIVSLLAYVIVYTVSNMF